MHFNGDDDTTPVPSPFVYGCVLALMITAILVLLGWMVVVYVVSR